MLYVTDLVTRKTSGAMRSQRFIIEAESPEQAKDKLITRIEGSPSQEAFGGAYYLKGKSIVVMPLIGDMYDIGHIEVKRSILKEQNLWKF